jgi:hypothetical protein
LSLPILIFEKVHVKVYFWFFAINSNKCILNFYYLRVGTYICTIWFFHFGIGSKYLAILLRIWPQVTCVGLHL